MIILVFGWKTATGPTEPNRENPAVSIGTNKPTISPIYKESMDWGTEKKIENNISKKQCVGRFLQSQKKGKLPACTKPFRGSRLSTRETTSSAARKSRMINSRNGPQCTCRARNSCLEEEQGRWRNLPQQANWHPFRALSGDWLCRETPLAPHASHPCSEKRILSVPTLLRPHGM